MKERCPVLFGDYEVEEVDGLDWYKTESGKVEDRGPGKPELLASLKTKFGEDFVEEE